MWSEYLEEYFSIALLIFQLDCSLAGIAQSSCAATDQACICTNEELAAVITACVAMNCTIPEQLGEFSQQTMTGSATTY